MTPIAYLIFQGQCREALSTYVDVFNAEITMMMLPSDMPDMDTPIEHADWIMHSELKFDGGTLYASDDLMGSNPPMAGAYVMVELHSKDAAHSAFEQLSNGGEIVMPFSPTPWSEGFGMLKDRFGTQWMLSAPSEMPDG